MHSTPHSPDPRLIPHADLDLEDDGADLDAILDEQIPAKRGRSPSLLERRNAFVAEHGPQLPTDWAALLKAAEVAAVFYHNAVINEDDEAFIGARHHYEAAVWRANGDTFSGCETDQGGQSRLRAALAATPGKVPHWGQAGEFLIEHSAILAVVKWPGFGGFGASLHAVDPTRRFISDTGFRSLTAAQPIFGLDVEDAARIWIEGLLKSEGRSFISHQFRQRDFRAAFPWLPPVNGHETRIITEANGQSAFDF